MTVEQMSLQVSYTLDEDVGSDGYGNSTTTSMTLHEVWQHNLEYEFAVIRSIIDHYPYVAMDTEFPGLVLTPSGQFKDKSDFNYKQMRLNVNHLKLIQVGLTFVNERGELPPGNDVWQFNFHFNQHEDTMAGDSGKLLRGAGIDFHRHQEEGISVVEFGELLTTSGLLADKRITWITFHSPFDFGYLIKCILLGELPTEQEEFLRYHRAFFPSSYDIKLLVRHSGHDSTKLRGGLQDIANHLQVPRIGQMHQAGSDSLLTAMTFFKLRQDFFGKKWDSVAKPSRGHMFGLGSTGVVM
jgi:CCR4-NOT transcription complex subunit 7/8